MSAAERALSPLARREDEAVFDEAWQAQALGIADLLVNEGVISADLWAQTLGAELSRAAAAGADDSAGTYYRAVLQALEAVLAMTGHVAAHEIDACEQAWRQAYLETPHGRPVELEGGGRSPS